MFQNDESSGGEKGGGNDRNVDWAGMVAIDTTYLDVLTRIMYVWCECLFPGMNNRTCRCWIYAVREMDVTRERK